MEMQTKRLVGVIAAGLLIITGITACGGGSSNSDPVGQNDDNDSGMTDNSGTTPPMTGGGTGSGSGSNQGLEQSNAPRNFGTANNQQIRPGVLIANGSCTSNFIFFRNATTFYIGTAAHCFAFDAQADPCSIGNDAIGSDVIIENASMPGKLAYSSWIAMQAVGTTDRAICDNNDFALVEINAADLANIHPKALVYGGPSAELKGLASVGDAVFTYGQSPLQQGVSTLEEKEGEITSTGQRKYRVVTDNPGLPGDSGSAVLHESGQGLGILVDVGTSIGLGSPVSNGVMRLDFSLQYAKDSGFLPNDVSLATWSEFGQ